MLQVILGPNTKSLLEALQLLGVTPVSSPMLLSPLPLRPPLHLHLYGTSTGAGLFPAWPPLHSYHRWLYPVSALYTAGTALYLIKAHLAGLRLYFQNHKYNLQINVSTWTSKPIAPFPDSSERVPLTICSISVKGSISSSTGPFHSWFLSFTHSYLLIYPSASAISSAFRIYHKSDHSITSPPAALTAFSGLPSPVCCPCCDIPSQTRDLYALRTWRLREACVSAQGLTVWIPDPELQSCSFTDLPESSGGRTTMPALPNYIHSTRPFSHWTAKQGTLLTHPGLCYVCDKKPRGHRRNYSY